MSEEKETHHYIYYGSKVTAVELKNVLKHLIGVNRQQEKDDKLKTPLCIWGRHGIGKTHVVEAIAKENNYKFTYIAPAQFEEMGDLTGMPRITNGATKLIPPEWVPKEEGPGILLIDDVNRADDRILRGIMQLLQKYELVSWQLPPKWDIILTANPDGGDYSVTPMDDAMLTRMMHITLQFEVKTWAAWAEQYGVDSRGINFVLSYPEIVTGHRTTPRTLVQFFDTVKNIEDWEKELPLMQMLADSCLDSNTVSALISFIQSNLSKLISAAEIVDAKNFESTVYKPLKAIIVKQTIRVDILAALCTRMVNYLTLNNIKPDKNRLENIKKFLLMDFMPNDIRLTTAGDLVSSENKHLKSIMADPEIGKLLLSKM